MLSAARHHDSLSDRRNALKAEGARRSVDNPSRFRVRQLNAQALSFSQWSLVPAPSTAGSPPRPHSEASPPSRRLPAGEYGMGKDYTPRREMSRLRSSSVSWGQRRMNTTAASQQPEDQAEGIGTIFNNCIRTLPSSHELVSALELKSLVGVGSMGTVYSATLLGQQVVCKIIEHDNSVALSRVKDRRGRAALEGQLGRLLSHPNIVAGYGAFSGTFPHSKLCVAGSKTAFVAGANERMVTLLIQEFCAGGPVRDALQNGTVFPTALADAPVTAVGAPLRRLKVLAQVAGQIAFGLAHMHAHHVVHCDLNASNVFLQPTAAGSGTEGCLGMVAKLGDLGIACIVPPSKDGVDCCAAGAMHGTVSHMPPEALSQGHTVSTCTDIWSFGMLLWELWTLQPPFDQLPPHDVVSKVLSFDLPPWPQDAPPVLAQIAKRCWSKDPAERPDALTLANTFTKLAAVLQGADAHQEAPRVAALAAGVLNKPPRDRHRVGQIQEDALEDALLDSTLDVELLKSPSSPSSLGTSPSLEGMPMRLEDCTEPAEDDNTAQLLWQMLHLPDPAECIEVSVTPLRSVVVAPLPYINTHKYMEHPLQL